MFLSNPILLLGLFGLIAALFLTPWFLSAKTPESKKAAHAVLTTLFVLGSAWVILGGAIGLSHMVVYQDCVAEKKDLEAKHLAAWKNPHQEGQLWPKDEAAELQFNKRCNTIITRYDPNAPL